MPPLRKFKTKVKAKMKAKVKIEKRKVKTEKGAQVKKEKVAVKKEIAVKKELADGASRTGVKAKKGFDYRTHYVHQMGFLDKQVKPPWKLCFGALGTGIIGIQPDKPSKSSSSSSKVKKELEDDVEEVRIPKEATVALLLNAPGMGVMGRNGIPTGGYGDVVDVKTRSLHWKSQRNDVNSTKIGAIIAHCRGGGRVVVGVRGSNTAADYSKLGVVTRVDQIQEAKFLVEEGSFVICDGAKLHKNIGPSCIDVGLRAGIGLVPKRYPLPENQAKQYKFCKACCYSEPNARLHFAELNKAGVAEYGIRERQTEENSAKRKLKVKKEAEAFERKQLKIKKEVKKEAPARAVKKEVEDSTERPDVIKKPAAKKVLGKMQKNSTKRKADTKPEEEKAPKSLEIKVEKAPQKEKGDGSGLKAVAKDSSATQVKVELPAKAKVKKVQDIRKALGVVTKTEPVTATIPKAAEAVDDRPSSEDCRIMFAMATAPLVKCPAVIEVEDCKNGLQPEIIGIDVE